MWEGSEGPIDEREDYLWQIWLDLNRRHSNTISSGDDFHILEKGYYDQPQRRYHTFSGHIYSMQLQAQEIRHLIDNQEEFDALQFAIFFHDAICESWADDNEQRSADLAFWFLTRVMKTPDSFAKKVAIYIMETKYGLEPNHRNYGGEALMSFMNIKTANYMMDLDLARMGAPPDEFDKLSDDVRSEFWWVDTDTYCRERIKILRMFLNRPCGIYQTAYFRDRYEEQAEENLLRAVEKLVASIK